MDAVPTLVVAPSGWGVLTWDRVKHSNHLPVPSPRWDLNKNESEQRNHVQVVMSHLVTSMARSITRQMVWMCCR